MAAPRPLRDLSCLIFCISIFSFRSFSQPPPQGPGVVGANPGEIAMSILLNSFEITVQKQIDTMNMKIAQDRASTGVDAHIGFSYAAFPPYLTPTLAMDHPNEMQVRMSMIVTYYITDVRWHHIPYFDRTISQSVDLYASCHNWWTDSGAVRILFAADPSHLDDNSFSEETVNLFFAHLLADAFDNRLRHAVQGQRDISDLPLSKCNCLGVTPGTDAATHYKESAILFQKKQSRFNNNVGNNSVLNNEIVTIQSIKRLPAHDLQGNILYEENEDLTVDVWINHMQRPLPVGAMKENDVKTFDNLKVTVPRPPDDGLLVVIANVTQQNNSYFEDSQFAAWGKSAGFGAGTKTLTVTKTFWEKPRQLPGGGVTKPIKMTAPAYEITLKIDLPGSQSTANAYRFDRRKSANANKDSLKKIALVTAFFTLFTTSFAVLSITKGFIKSELSIIFSATGILFGLLGHFMATVKPNYFVGVRVPWTLANEENWRDTHLFTGRLWFWGGLSLAVIAFFLPLRLLVSVFIAITIILSIGPIIYSYAVYRRRKVV